MPTDYLGTALGIGAGIIQQGQQNQQTQGLMNQQMYNQMNLNNQMQDIQQENWDYTNYENQVKHMRNAGLNIGLMYGGSGAGGSTMGGASGGSAAMGQPAPPINTMEIAAQMMQAKLLQAEVDLKKAQENEIISRTPTSGNLGDATLNDLTQTAAGKKIANEYASGNLNTALEMSKQVLENTKAENTKLVAEGKKEQIEADYEERQQKLKLISQGIENLYKLQLTKESKAKITNMQEMLKVEQQNATSNDRNSRANAKKADADFSNSLTNSLRQLNESLGEDANTENRKVIEELAKLIGMGSIGMGQAAKGGNTYNYNSNFQ